MQYEVHGGMAKLKAIRLERCQDGDSEKKKKKLIMHIELLKAIKTASFKII